MNNEPLVMSVDENGHRTQTGDRGIAALRKLPAACCEELQPCESFLQLAARNCNPAKASCSMQREIATLRKFPARCSTKSQGKKTNQKKTDA